jgi:hypothetical protein
MLGWFFGFTAGGVDAGTVGLAWTAGFAVGTDLAGTAGGAAAGAFGAGWGAEKLRES